MADHTRVRAVPDRTGRPLRPHHQLMARSTSATVLSAVRVVISFFFVCHAAQKLFGLLGGLDGHGGTAQLGTWPGWWAGIIELVGGTLVLLGLFTRPAALLCSGEMAFAYFTVHQPHAALPLQNHGELAAMFSWIFLLFAAVGPGWFSLDALVARARDQVTRRR